MTNFTPEDLLLYLYKETTAAQTTAIKATLINDWTLREKLEVLKLSMQRLDKITITPRTEIILDVLNYAREHAAEKVWYTIKIFKPRLIFERGFLFCAHFFLTRKLNNFYERRFINLPLLFHIQSGK